MDSSDDFFIGEGSDHDAAGDVENPLALSSREGSPTSSDGSGDDEAEHGVTKAEKRAVTMADAKRLLADTETILKAFHVAAGRARGHQYLSCATPAQAGTFAVAGLARLRSRIAAEEKHVRQSIADENLGRLRGNNVAAIAVSVAILGTEPDVSAVMCHVGSGNKSVELDLITDGGQRWVKVKASSPENFMREVGLGMDGDESDDEAPASDAASVLPPATAAAKKPEGGGSSRRGGRGFLPEAGDSSAPFLDTLRILLRAAAEPQFQLPFGRRPHLVVACAQEPPAAVRHVLMNLCPSIELCAIRSAVPRTSLATELGKGPDMWRIHALPPPLGFPVKWVNFDVTAMVALICDCCHGHAGTDFPDHHILRQQSRDEASGIRAVAGYVAPVILRHTVWGPPPAAPPSYDEAVRGACEEGDRMPPAPASAAGNAADGDDSADAGAVRDDELCALDDPLAAASNNAAATLRRQPPWETHWPQNWIASEVALAELQWIVDTIAGDEELRRFRWLTRRVQPRPQGLTSPGVEALRGTKRVQMRHRAVFGLGDLVEAITISGNKTFVQAAQEQGLALLVAFHPSRALTERKRLGIDVSPKTQPPLPPDDRPGRNVSGTDEAADDQDAAGA